ncbi:MAG: type 1 periplasmic binding fold superfamily protein [Flavobacteriaceae bacterium]
MKKSIFLIPLLILALIFTGCSKDDPPAPVNEEELITTMTVTLSPVGGGSDIILKTVDMDGDGGNEPVITVNGVTGNEVSLTVGTSYEGSIELLNESEDPAEDITEEVQEEAEEHQFFYTASSSLDVTTNYEDEDGDGNPIGVEFILVANAVSSGDLTFTLRHKPNKSAAGVSNGDITNAGGETDITETFSITIE